MRYAKIWIGFGILTVGSVLAGLVFVDDTVVQPSTVWELPVIPHPQEIQLKDDRQSFVLMAATKISVFTNAESLERVEVELINAALHAKGMAPLEVVRNSHVCRNIIIIGEVDAGCSFLDSLVSSHGWEFMDDYPGPEGYILDVSPDYVVVAGHDSSGTFYGVQSLIQLIVDDNITGELKVKPATIVDYPDMELRSAFYGFYLNALENDRLIERAYADFKKFAQHKFNMIDLATHHYAHLEMQVPGHRGEKLWQRFAKLHREARRYNMRPRVGGWAKWVNTRSPWGADLTTLEGIRTSQMIEMKGTSPYTLKISSGQVAPNVMHNFASGQAWAQEPVVVTDESGSATFEEGRDYAVNFGRTHSEDYRKYHKTSQTSLQVIVSEVHAGEGEPAEYPLRWAESFNAPTTIQRLQEGRIRDGQQVKVTFSYIGPDPWSLLKVRYCRSDSRLHTNGPENYVWRWCTDPIRFWGADDFSLDVDETRVFAWDKRCLESGKSRSEIWVDDI
ncbi:MAG: hypothetical protein O7C75_12470, partial [Verrucomicrobia bacterium]|nr:hypothetical protein [Verrucomicrobiota bacterium]